MLDKGIYNVKLELKTGAEQVCKTIRKFERFIVTLQKTLDDKNKATTKKFNKR